MGRLIEGYLVEKMTQYPPYTISQELCRSALARVIPVAWHVRGEKPLRIPNRVSMPEPDVAVARGEIRDYLAGILDRTTSLSAVEVSDSSLDDDRNVMTRVYGGGGVTRYSIVSTWSTARWKCTLLLAGRQNRSGFAIARCIKSGRKFPCSSTESRSDKSRSPRFCRELRTQCMAKSPTTIEARRLVLPVPESQHLLSPKHPP